MNVESSKISRGLRILLWAQIPVTILAIGLSIYLGLRVEPLIKTDRLYETQNDAAIDSLKKQISGTLDNLKIKKIAVLDFTNLDGSIDNLGRYVSEQLTSALIREGRFELVPRSQLDVLLRKHELSVADVLTASDKLKPLGKSNSLGALITGSIIELRSAVDLNAAVADAKSGNKLPIAPVALVKDQNVLDLLGKKGGTNHNLSGKWKGFFSYPSLEKERGQRFQSVMPPVKFEVSIESEGSSFSGKISEPQTFGSPTADRMLHAEILDGIIMETGEVMFIKKYDGSGGQEHEVLYEGYLQRQDIIEGKWFMRPRWWGTFRMVKQ
jgi:TolB-like protein